MSELQDCPNLPRLEWDTSGCPDAELSDLRAYEFTREVPILRRAVIRWRAAVGVQSYERLLALDRSGTRAPIKSLVCATWPEWPFSPYLSVPEIERARRLKILYPGEEAMLIAGQLEPDPALLLDDEEGFCNVVRQLRKNWQAGRRLHVYPSNFEEHVLLRIPWWMSNSEILRLFKTWLKVNSPSDRQLFTPEGRGTFERRARADLKALAALRVLRANKDDWTLPPALYSEQSEWIRSCNHALVIIEGLAGVLR